MALDVPPSPFREDLFDGKRVLVTGGSSGIGLGIARAFARHGAHVFITGRNKEKLSGVVETLMDEYDYVEGHAFDVRDRDAVEEVAATLTDGFGPMDVVVNNAAGNFLVPFVGMSENAWDSVVNIVLQGTANVTRAFGKSMYAAGMTEADKGSAQDRSILNIVAGYAWTGAAGVSHSGAAKAGVLNLTKSLAVEWGNAGVRCNAISPGPIDDTGGARHLWENEMVPKNVGEMIKNSVPLRRFGSIDEMGSVALFLASPAASYVTGMCLCADGGMDAIGPFPMMGQMAQRLAEASLEDLVAKP